MIPNSKKARQTGTDRKTEGEKPRKLESNRLYQGVVMNSNRKMKLFDVMITERGELVRNCIWAGGVFSTLAGINTSYIPPTGSRVWLLYDGTGYVMGMVPNQLPDNHAGGSKTVSGVPEAMALSDQWKTQDKSEEAVGFLGQGLTPGADELEGEFDLVNALGVGVSMLTTIAKLQAGDRAKVEACLLNDMVRIVSETFKHYSSFGDFEIYNDGRLNVVFNGTSYEHEAFGQMTAQSPKVPSTGTNMVDFSSIDAMAETGRWRFSEYIGWLGDFFHQIISDPVNALGTYAQSVARAGKARTQVMSDGTVLMQSCNEIVLERTNRVLVPMQLRRWDDPEGDTKKAMDSLISQHSQFLRDWQHADNPVDMSKACYQLREYARWLNQYHSFARFLQLQKDWKIPSEAETPAPDPSCQEKDRQQVNHGAVSIQTYSTFRIMRDGSQLHFDGWGNVWLSSLFGIQMGSPRHFELNVGGDIIMNAGQNIRLKARKNIDIVSVIGGIKIKARAFWQALCELGTFWIKSDAPLTPADSSGEEVPPENFGQAIRLDAPLAPIWIQADQGCTTIVNKDSWNLVVKLGDANVNLAKGSVNTQAKGGTNFFTPQMFLDGNMVVGGSSLRVGSGFVVSGGKVTTTRIETGGLTSAGSIKGPEFTLGDPPHKNHIQVTAPDFKLNFGTAPDKPAKPAPIHEARVPNWKFASRSQMLWDSGYKIRETLSQQFMRLGDLLPGGVVQPEYGVWNYEQDDKLLAAPRTEKGSLPWPGGATHETYSGGDSLHSPSAKTPDEHGPVPVALKAEAIKHFYRKSQ